MISGRKHNNGNPLPKFFGNCADLITKADWLAENNSHIKISTAGYVKDHDCVTTTDYENVLRGLIAENKFKEALFLSIFILDCHREHSSNPLSIWVCLASPETRDKIESINLSIYGPIAKFSPSLLHVSSTGSAFTTLYLMYMLKWLVENKPSDSLIAAFNALPLKEGTGSSLIEPDETFLTRTKNTIFTPPQFLSNKSGVAHFFGKTLDTVIANRPEEEKQLITGEIKAAAMQNAYLDMQRYYDRLKATPRQAASGI